MNPVTHLLAGWIVANESRLAHRDRAIVIWSSVVPDLDGLGYIVNLYNDLIGTGQTAYYENFHHNIGHGLPAALVTGVTCYLISIEKKKTTLLAFLTFHLHLLMDLAGSRGSNPIDIWPIAYLSPVSNYLTIAWSGQWPLTSWQNTTITMVLMLICFWMAVKKDYSFVSLFNKQAD